MDATHIADQVLTASVALAGLLLVSISGVVTAYESYPTEAQSAIRSRYRWRGWFSFGGFAVSLLSALSALLYYWIKSDCLIDTSAGLLVLALMGAFVAALISIKDIK
jgi:hypothetical protein